MRIAVAGGTGFVGRHVVEALSARGHTVLVLARGERATPNGAALLRCDVAREEVPAGALRGCDGVVNLAGIKGESGTQTFEAVHVAGTERLLAACRQQGIRRFVHLSVVCSRPDAESPYHDTKWRAEESVRASGLDATILKPGVIYGPGDDMVTHLVKMIRFAAVFPVVGRGASLLQPVDVRDVAEAVAAALERPQSVGRTYDLVGPERHTLSDVVRTVAQATGLRLFIVPTPLALQRVAVRVMEAVTPRPLSTPAQLRMLVDGLYGDPEPARHDLGIVPRPFTVGTVLRLAGAIPPLFGFSLRLVRHRSQAEWLARRGRAVAPAVVLALAAPLVQWALAQTIANVWYRMGVGAVLLSAFALLRVPVGWAELWRPRPRDLARGAAAAVGLYLAGALVVRALVTSPALAAQMADVYGWRRAVPDALAVPLLLLIVLGEEIVWRGAITLPLAARLGPWAGVLLGAVAFAVAHVPLGMPVLLLAALGAGAFWSALAIKTRSLVPALVSHVLWDLAVLFWLPYAIPAR
jgi:NADH dehydrogenase